MPLDARTARRFVQALDAECRRNVKHLKVPGYPRPYYLSYLLRDIHSLHIWGRLGNINQVTDQYTRNVFCDCRVGSYRFDQISEGGLDDHDAEGEVSEHVEMPIGNDTDALKYHLWKLTDARYREAVRHYLRKKSEHITYLDPTDGLASFRRGVVRKDVRLRAVQPVDVEAWIDFIVRSSRVVKRYPEVKNSWVEVRVRDATRIFVSSEGSQVVDQSRVCELACDLWLLTKKGEAVATRVVHVSPTVDDLPDLHAFVREIEQKIDVLRLLSQAPTLKSYAGPVLLAPGPAGILFHEVLGHRLEGTRLLSTREGQTFSRDLGKQILPPFLSVTDDPTMRRSCGVNAVGCYRYDDEGTPAQPARLVERGKLVGFLSGRSPVTKAKLPPNGHARNEYHERPIARMAHLIVEAEKGVSHAELRRLFLEELRRQKLPFGIMILEAEGGETATDSYDFQAFMGQVTLAVQVWADGRENLVRNVNFVGTPLSALRNVVAAGDSPRCDNAYCGAESGVVPVSTTSPAILMSNLELQAGDQRKFVQYVLPMPFEKKAALRGRARRRRS
ncbi:MAG: TldD/PmbA family protein [Deltaproteobacteria bacterium]|nr:TldD/PmbA family protein [Deltaproteobacteria bacterium]